MRKRQGRQQLLPEPIGGLGREERGIDQFIEIQPHAADADEIRGSFRED
jgi:hypothetical protein